MLTTRSHADVVESNGAPSVPCRRLLNERVCPYLHRALSNLNGGAVEVDVLPAQPQEFPAAHACVEGQQPQRAVTVVLGLAIVVGLLNGIGVAYAGIPPIIMTLGMNGALQGLMLVYTHGGFSSTPPQALIALVTGTTIVFGLPWDLLIWGAVIVIGTVLLTGSTFGRTLYAIGTNRTAACLTGVHVKRVLVIPYVVSAVSPSFSPACV